MATVTGACIVTFDSRAFFATKLRHRATIYRRERNPDGTVATDPDTGRPTGNFEQVENDVPCLGQAVLTQRQTRGEQETEATRDIVQLDYLVFFAAGQSVFEEDRVECRRADASISVPLSDVKLVQTPEDEIGVHHVEVECKLIRSGQRVGA